MLTLTIICFALCCRNLREARNVSKNFSKEYTGLDTLIKLDGYYYYEDSTELCFPLVFSKNSEFKTLFSRFKTHEELQNIIRRSEIGNYGTYTLVGNIINVKWASRYNPGCYEIFSEQYVIENDTTLRLIWHLCETCETYSTKRDPIRNDIYKFFKY